MGIGAEDKYMMHAVQLTALKSTDLSNAVSSQLIKHSVECSVCAVRYDSVHDAP